MVGRQNDPAAGSTIRWTKSGCQRVCDGGAVACPHVSPPAGVQEPASPDSCGPSYYCSVEADCCKGTKCVTRHMNIAAVLLGIADTAINFPLGSCSSSPMLPRDSLRRSDRNAVSVYTTREAVAEVTFRHPDRGIRKHPSKGKRGKRSGNNLSVPYSEQNLIRRDDWAECLREFGSPSAAACLDAWANMPGTLDYRTFGHWFTNAQEALPQSWSATRGW